MEAIQRPSGPTAPLALSSNRTSNTSPPSNSGQGSVQIMEFEEVQEHAENQTRKVIMMDKEFRKVIEKCTPGAHVAVLAIAGKANKGKSLFLSFVLRYLNALKNGQSKQDWTRRNDPLMKDSAGPMAIKLLPKESGPGRSQSASRTAKVKSLMCSSWTHKVSLMRKLDNGNGIFLQACPC